MLNVGLPCICKWQHICESCTFFASDTLWFISFFGFKWWMKFDIWQTVLIADHILDGSVGQQINSTDNG